MIKDVGDDDLCGPQGEEGWVASKRRQELVIWRLESERSELRLAMGWAVLKADMSHGLRVTEGAHPAYWDGGGAMARADSSRHPRIGVERRE